MDMDMDMDMDMLHVHVHAHVHDMRRDLVEADADLDSCAEVTFARGAQILEAPVDFVFFALRSLLENDQEEDEDNPDDADLGGPTRLGWSPR